MLLTALWLLLFVSLVGWLAYHRASLASATLALGVLLAAYTLWGAGAPWWKAVLWVLYVPHVLLNIRPLRRALISNRFLLVFKRMLPPMSRTEREALEAGTVWWDGELFTGGPDWNKLLSAKAPTTMQSLATDVGASWFRVNSRDIKQIPDRKEEEFPYNHVAIGVLDASMPNAGWAAQCGGRMPDERISKFKSRKADAEA